MSPELRIEYVKRSDGSVVLRCTRKDGSVTWEVRSKHAEFFAFHDLSHFAVETVLRFQKGFFGLIADGWDIVDTAGKGPRGKPPVESGLVEHIVGLFSSEQAGGAPPLAAADFNRQLREMMGIEAVRVITDAELVRVRQRIEELLVQWAAVPRTSSLELIFDRNAVR
jgi:hypothetical protein